MTDDADFLERMGRLAGQTTYRVPVEGNGTRFGEVPCSHALVVTLCGARGRKWQPGPEIAWAVATGVQHKREAVIEWLATKLYYWLGGSKKYRDKLRPIAEVAYLRAIGVKPVVAIKFDRNMDRAADIGASWLGMCMDETLSRAEQPKSRSANLGETVQN